jgi:signal transduction histidine kinase
MTAQQRREIVQSIQQSSRRMNNIIDELLLLASVRKKEDVQTVPLDMETVVENALDRLAYMVNEWQAEIVLPGAWPVAMGYGSWVEEVWANYISNAIKYGGRPPRVELGATAQSDGVIHFWVLDNGPGLTPEERDRLFTPFTRLDQASAKGHGLGLSIVRRIVERLGGQAGVESEAGQGSRFYFTLPAAPPLNSAD